MEVVGEASGGEVSEWLGLAGQAAPAREDMAGEPMSEGVGEWSVGEWKEGVRGERGRVEGESVGEWRGRVWVYGYNYGLQSVEATGYPSASVATLAKGPSETPWANC